MGEQKSAALDAAVFIEGYLSSIADVAPATLEQGSGLNFGRPTVSRDAIIY